MLKYTGLWYIGFGRRELKPPTLGIKVVTELDVARHAKSLKPQLNVMPEAAQLKLQRKYHFVDPVRGTKPYSDTAAIRLMTMSSTAGRP